MVKWSIPARDDLKQIHDYIARDSKNYAQKVKNEIIEKADQLVFFPKRGRIVPEIGDTKIREIFIYSYRIIYEANKNDIVIVALLHSRRNFPSDSIKNRI